MASSALATGHAAQSQPFLRDAMVGVCGCLNKRNKGIVPQKYIVGRAIYLQSTLIQMLISFRNILIDTSTNMFN